MRDVKTTFSIAYALALFFLSESVLASECVIAENFKGYAAKVRGDLKPEQDGMTSTKYVIYINGEKSNVVGSDMEKYFQTSPNSILSISGGQDQSVVETWSIYKKQKKVLYTKTVNGYSMFDGANMFIGEIVGDCTSEQEKALK